MVLEAISPDRKKCLLELLLSACHVGCYCSADMSAGSILTVHAVCRFEADCPPLPPAPPPRQPPLLISHISLRCVYCASSTLTVWWADSFFHAGSICSRGTSAAATSIIFRGRHFTWPTAAKGDQVGWARIRLHFESGEINLAQQLNWRVLKWCKCNKSASYDF